MDIRAFDGMLGDATGVIAVDGETFGDCRYTPQYITELVETDRQHVWVAEEENSIVGFVSVFATHSLSGDRWEIDELAVRPSAQGQGIGTALVGRARDAAPSELPARAVIATDNAASQRAFAKNGFSPGAKRHLLVCDASQPFLAVQASAIPTRCATLADVETLSGLSGQPAERVLLCLEHMDNVYLIAGSNQGYVELLYVHTLQYAGFWLESIRCRNQDPQLIRVLLDAAVELVFVTGTDQVADLLGHLAAPQNSAIYQACLEHRFAKIGEYQDWIV